MCFLGLNFDFFRISIWLLVFYDWCREKSLWYFRTIITLNKLTQSVRDGANPKIQPLPSPLVNQYATNFVKFRFCIILNISSKMFNIKKCTIGIYTMRVATANI